MEAEELQRITHVRADTERELLERQAARLAADLQADETTCSCSRALKRATLLGTDGAMMSVYAYSIMLTVMARK